MTFQEQQEQQEYNLLSKGGQMQYDLQKQLHPDWSHSQLMMSAKVMGVLGDRLTKPGGDPNEPDFLIQVLIEAKKWLNTFTKVSKDVISLLDNAINELCLAIERGVAWLGNKISDFLNWLFN